MTPPTDHPPRALLCAQGPGPHVRAFEEAASELGVRLVHVTERGVASDLPAGDRLAVPFDRGEGLDAVAAAHACAPVSGIVALDDAAAVFAAAVAARLGLPFHTPAGAQAAGDPLLTRGRLLSADLPTPWFVALPPGLPVEAVLDRVRLPCVVRTLHHATSHAAVRVDDVAQLTPAVHQVRGLARKANGSAEAVRPGETSPSEGVTARSDASAALLLEGFVPGRLFTLEGVMERGQLLVLAIFEGDGALDGLGRETIFVTPPSLAFDDQRRMAAMIVHGALAMGLRHGPIHAECRVGDAGMFPAQIAARPIIGPCARALRFVNGAGATSTLEALVLRHAVGQSIEGWGREPEASGVGLLPVERAGRLRCIEGVDTARRVNGVTDVEITAQRGDFLAPPPDGASALGSVHARAATTAAVVRALQAARAALSVHLDADAPVA